MTPVTRLGLIARSHPSATAALIEAAEWLTTRGATVVIANDVAVHDKATPINPPEMISASTLWAAARIPRPTT